MNDYFGISGLELNWFESYLTNREQVCSVNRQTSSSGKIICGVPQGSILGALIYLLYINDMPDCLKSTTPCLYADDTDIFTSSRLLMISQNLLEIETLILTIFEIGLSKTNYNITQLNQMFIGSSFNLNNKVCDNCFVK